MLSECGHLSTLEKGDIVAKEINPFEYIIWIFLCMTKKNASLDVDRLEKTFEE